MTNSKMIDTLIYITYSNTMYIITLCCPVLKNRVKFKSKIGMGAREGAQETKVLTAQV